MSYYTQNPEVDAANWMDDQEAFDAANEASEKRAFDVILAEFKALKPAQWHHHLMSSAMYPDESLIAYMGKSDVYTKFAELMASPAAHGLLEELARAVAKDHHWTICPLEKPDNEPV